LDMCRMSRNIHHMDRGPSGRLVVDIDPALKQEIHSRLAAEGRTLKDWFLEQVERHLLQPTRPSLPFE